MATETLRELYHAELQDLYEAEHQIVKALAKLASMATDAQLKNAFDRHLEQSRIHVERLELLFDEYELPKAGSGSAAIEALIQNSERRAQSMTDSDVRDAALIAAAQLVAHYEIAGYGCARAYARQLGFTAAADVLQQTLGDERAADEQLTDIATVINGVATPDVVVDESRSSRLRYVGGKHFDRATHEYTDHKVRNAIGEELGQVNGFLINAAGRPYYLVVDSGGLFVGRRYIIPIGKVGLDRSTRTFLIDFTKETLKRYPEFHQQSFRAMTDEEARLYEWRVLEAVDPESARETPPDWQHENLPHYRQPEWTGTELKTAADRVERGVVPERTVAVSQKEPGNPQEESAPQLGETTPNEAPEERRARS
jgi:ferritin-like metal-binding protein YciE